MLNLFNNIYNSEEIPRPLLFPYQNNELPKKKSDLKIPVFDSEIFDSLFGLTSRMLRLTENIYSCFIDYEKSIIILNKCDRLNITSLSDYFSILGLMLKVQELIKSSIGIRVPWWRLTMIQQIYGSIQRGVY